MGENRFLTCGLLGVYSQHGFVKHSNDGIRRNPNEIFPEQSTNPLPIFAAPNLWLKNGGYLMAWEFFGGVFLGRSLPQVPHRREMDQMEFDLLVFGIVSECIGGICDLVVYLAL